MTGTASLPALLSRWAASTPSAPALIEAGRPLSYAELDARVSRFARLFQQCGVQPGDRVVMAIENGAAMVGAYLGAMRAGGVAVPLPGGARSDRLVSAMADCTPRVAIVDVGASRLLTAQASTLPETVFVVGRNTPEGMQSLDSALLSTADAPVADGAGDNDLAAIIYTSGSTGRPRGVMLSHANFLSNAQSIVSYLNLTADDRVMCVLPFHYVYGLSLLHTHLMVGASIVVENRTAFPNVVLNGMREHEVTGFAGVPSTFALLLHRSNLADTALPHLRYVTQAGGGMAPARILEWLERGPHADFYVMYGATEASARLTYLPPADLRRKIGSIGRAIPGVTVSVVNDEGREAAAGDVGELVAQGRNIARGYWNDPDETARKFGPAGYRTGDLGYVDEDGYLFLVGRQGDMIKVGANRVGAREIEDVLNEHPMVLEATVVAAPHELLGEVPVAFVALRAPMVGAVNGLRAFCAERLTAYKVPARVEVIDELPKLSGSGKVDKPLLREQAAREQHDVETIP